MKSKSILLLLFMPSMVFAAQTLYMEPVGFNRLRADLGPALPTGTNISVTQVEGADGGNYMPNTNDVAFTGKTIRNRTASSNGVLQHATDVGTYFYGHQASMASNITVIDVREANNWLGAGFLQFGSPNLAPLVETNLIQNHSWVGDIAAPTTTNILRRLDYAIDRDGFTCVVGVNNGSNSVLWGLLAQANNTISVGLSDGQHSHGMTVFDEPGRPKPEIVAPETASSWATPIVGAAAAMLMEAARAQGWTNALRPEAIKALLMAGATKGKFPGWDRTPGRPIDEHYGAGELNIYNSYNMLMRGQHAPSTTSEVTTAGWDLNTASTSTPSFYFFSVPETNVMAGFSAMLVWNRHLADTDAGLPFTLAVSPADLDLKLYSATGFSLGPLVDLSTSVVCNIEHIYRLKLDAGQYAMSVQTATTNASYALAWRGHVMAEPEFSLLSPTGSVLRMESLVSTGFAYITQASTNLLNTNGWFALETNLVLQSPFPWTDTQSSNSPLKYYRLIPDP